MKCSLIFPDGESVTGTVEARAANAGYPIAYAGPAHRLGRQLERGAPEALELLFKVAAQRTGAMLSVEKSGTYDFDPEAENRGVSRWIVSPKRGSLRQGERGGARFPGNQSVRDDLN